MTLSRNYRRQTHQTLKGWISPEDNFHKVNFEVICGLNGIAQELGLSSGMFLVQLLLRRALRCNLQRLQWRGRYQLWWQGFSLLCVRIATEVTSPNLLTELLSSAPCLLPSGKWKSMEETRLDIEKFQQIQWNTASSSSNSEARKMAKFDFVLTHL